MLYCPKCRRAYEEGKRRFCDYDGVRLLPTPARQQTHQQQSGGVFASLFSKISELQDLEETTVEPSVEKPLKESSKTESVSAPFPKNVESIPSAEPLEPGSENLSASEAATDASSVPVAGSDATSGAAEIETAKPSPRIVRPNEIPSGTASVGDRKINPAGRTALSWDNQEALLGQTVKGRYQISEQLGEDGETIVYLASDKIVEGRRAIVRVFMETDPSGFDFAEKRVSLAHLKHPNIAAVIDSGELPEGKGFIVSEFVAGKSLEELLGASGEFNALRTARMIRQISYALSEAHQHGVLHGSLTPENIVLTVTEAGNEQVKLLNFGLSYGDWTAETLAYKAPEEIEEGISSFASDIYSLGVIAFQLLTTRLPFYGETEKQILKEQKSAPAALASSFRPDVPAAVDKILHKALAFNPSERYPKARDFGEAFFNAITSAAPPEEKAENLSAEKTNAVESKNDSSKLLAAEPADDALPSADIHITSSLPAEEPASLEKQPALKAERPKAWFESEQTPAASRRWLVILSAVLVFALLIGIWLWLLNR